MTLVIAGERSGVAKTTVVLDQRASWLGMMWNEKRERMAVGAVAHMI